MKRQIVDIVNSRNGITTRELGQEIGVHFEDIGNAVRTCVENGSISCLGYYGGEPGCYSAILMPRLVGTPPIRKTESGPQPVGVIH